jgi:NIMA (never in mitosis gene a)-related kinase
MHAEEQQEAIAEVHVLASLQHEYVVQYYDSFIDRGGLSIVMEYCDGGDLASLLRDTARRGTHLSTDDVRRFSLQVASALSFVHEKNVIHRDIKAANVFLASSGPKVDVRLGDFGVSKLLSSATELAVTKVGTPYYMSPELCESRPYSCKSDMWAFGCLVFEMCELHPPFTAGSIASLVLKIIRARYAPFILNRTGLLDE